MSTASFLHMLTSYGSSVDIYRSPSSSGGSIGAPERETTGGTVLISPNPDDGELAAAGLADYGGGRISHLGFCVETLDVRPGDEVRQGSTVYAVNGLGEWGTYRALALSKVEVT